MKRLQLIKLRGLIRLAELCLFTGIMVAACTREAVKPDAETVAEEYCQKGWAYWQSEQVEAAQYYFQKSVEKDSAYAPGYEGLARVALLNHQTANSWRLVQKSLYYQPLWISSILIKARIQYERRHFDEAIGSLRQILKIYAKNKSALERPGDLEDALILLAKCYRDSGRYEQALAAIDLVIKENPQSMYYCDLQEYLQLAVAALKNNSSLVRDTAHKETITRGELAALIYEWFAGDMNETMQNVRRPDDVTEEYRYKREIMAAIRTQLIPVYPDGTYRPQREVNRAELALILLRLIESVEDSDRKIITGIEAGPLCDDVPQTRYYYHAVQIMISHKIIMINHDRKFYPDRTIKGMEGVLGVYQARRLLDDQR